MTKHTEEGTALNAICAYFTMFPLDFPYSILKQYSSKGEWVLDPFCGRGTTNYASRILGLPSVGIDSNPVAVALSQAKLANSSPQLIERVTLRILDEVETPKDIPTGEFWEWAFDKDVLQTICRLREGLLNDCRSDSRKALRAIILGALHGPRGKEKQSYFSNQAPRTYAPKPRYSVNFWKQRALTPQYVNVIEIIKERAQRYFSNKLPNSMGNIIRGDSRKKSTYFRLKTNSKINWVITSPPYYGIRTYLPDQWLRCWFMGRPQDVQYSAEGQLEHSSKDGFALELKQVWQNVGLVCNQGAKLIVRFGAINSRKTDSLKLIKQSFIETGWRIQTLRSAGSASKGRRQAYHFSDRNKEPLEEYDVWAIWEG